MQGALEYAEYFHCAFLFNPEIRKVLFIGLGGGTGPIQFLHSYPGVLVDVVEIDPVVIRAARKFFGLPNHRRLRIVESDGRAFVRKCRRKYDLLVVDAYMTVDGRNLIPPHLTTLEFFREAERRLTPQGMICYNVIGMPYGLTSAMPRAVAKTLLQVFPAVCAFDVVSSENTVLFALRRGRPLGRSECVERARNLHRTGRIPLTTIVDRARSLYPRPLALPTATLLTDAEAPVERLLREAGEA